MWLTLLAIIALTITTSQCHDEQDQKIVKTITDQDINTNRVRRFVTGTGYPNKPGYLTTQNKTNGYNISTPGFKQNRNKTIQLYLNNSSHYPVSKTMKPGYTQTNYSRNQAPTLWPNSLQNLKLKATRNSTGYPVPNIMELGYTQFPGNNSSYPARVQPQIKNVPTANASLLQPAQNNSTAYRVSNTTKPGYTQFPSNISGYPTRIKNVPTANASSLQPAKNNKTEKPGNSSKQNLCILGNKTEGMDACVVTSNGECSDGKVKYNGQCIDKAKYIEYDIE